jgi:hypothetical protein
MATTVDWIVGGSVAILGLFILYRALKEPIDLALGFIGRGIGSAIEWVVNSGNRSSGDKVISYG